MSINYITKDVLFDLYTQTDLIKVKNDDSVSHKVKRTKIEVEPLNYLTLTPISKRIYDTLISSPDKKMFLKDIAKDNAIIEEINSYYEKNDKLYEDERPDSLGFYIEHWLSANLRCPICNQYTLCIYEIPNMPVIDLACINNNHKIEHGVKFFQVKTKNIFSSYFSDPYKLYFSKKDKYIYTGSLNFGYNSHMIKGSENIEDKKILLGYICITYTQNENYVNIIKGESFILLPKINNTNDNYYYQYLKTDPKPVIKWNDDMNDILNIPDDIKKIKISQLKEERVVNNIFLRPLLFAGDRDFYYRKYNKYLNKIKKIV